MTDPQPIITRLPAALEDEREAREQAEAELRQAEQERVAREDAAAKERAEADDAASEANAEADRQRLARESEQGK